MGKEETLVFLKPDAVIRRGIGARVIREILNNDFEIEYFSKVKPSRNFIATKHYAQHKGKFFYDWLIKYVNSSYLLLFIISGTNVIHRIRELLGPTLPEKASDSTLRGRYGILGGINIAHASDNVKNAQREISLWKEIIDVSQPSDYVEEAVNYIEKYINYPVVDTEEYRKISTLIIEKKIDLSNAKDRITEFLQGESDFENKTISHFADVIIENALLRKREVMKK